MIKYILTFEVEATSEENAYELGQMLEDVVNRVDINPLFAGNLKILEAKKSD